MGMPEGPKAVVSLRAFEHTGYWHVVMKMDRPEDDIDTVDSRVIRMNENIPLSTDWRDQVWIVLVYALKHLEYSGAAGRSGGIDFPAMF